MKNDTIHIAFCLDHGYLMPTGIAMISICENNLAEDICFHIVATIKPEESTSWYNVLEAICKRYRKKIENYKITADEISKFVCRGNEKVTPSAFVRILLPKILPSSIHKVIYFDGDIVICDSIRGLWEIDIDNDCPLGAVQDRISNSGSLREKIGTPLQIPYVNSGVLLMNLDIWRNEDLTSACIDFAQQTPSPYLDQDTINKVLCGRIEPLPMKYNMQVSFWIFGENEWMVDGCRMEEVRQGKLTPVVIHFATANKPWLGEYCPMRDVWEKYENHSPWKGQKHPKVWVYMQYSWVYQQFQQGYYAANSYLRATFPIYILPVLIYRKLRSVAGKLNRIR